MNDIEDFEIEDLTNSFYNEDKEIKVMNDTYNECIEVNYNNIENTKKYINRIYNLDLPKEIKQKTLDNISCINDRFHKISDEELCAHVISSYYELGLEIDFYKIYDLFGINHFKNNVTKYLSNTSTIKKSTVEVNLSVNIILIPSIDLIEGMFNLYINKYNIKHKVELNAHIIRCKNLCSYICNFNKRLIEIEPYTFASAIIFLYLKMFTNYKNKVNVFSQKVFSQLDNVNSKKFIYVYKTLVKTFESIEFNDETDIHKFIEYLNKDI